jgi:hypothetical protein
MPISDVLLSRVALADSTEAAAQAASLFSLISTLLPIKIKQFV